MSVWSLLGIEPTGDTSVIRRAYARRLKAMRPDEDPDAFQRLRAARETALGAAAGFRETGDARDDRLEVHVLPSDTPAPDVGAPKDDEPPVPDASFGASVDLPEIVVGPQAQREASGMPRQRIVEIAPLAEQGVHWDRAAQLRPDVLRCLAPLDADRGIVDAAAFGELIGQAAMLPLGPRREVEAACLEELTRDWRAANGKFRRRKLARILPLLRRADQCFGWSRDDSVVTATLAPADADALALMLDAADYRDRSSKLPAVLRLRRADVETRFSQSPEMLELYDDTLARGSMPWRIRWLALLAPHIWAFRRRLWIEFAVIYMLVCGPAVISLMNIPPSGPLQPRIAIAAAVLFGALLVAAGFLADRIAFAAAARAVRRADARCLFDRKARQAYLSERARKIDVFAIAILYLGAAFFFFPYAVLFYAFGGR